MSFKLKTTNDEQQGATAKKRTYGDASQRNFLNDRNNGGEQRVYRTNTMSFRHRRTKHRPTSYDGDRNERQYSVSKS